MANKVAIGILSGFAVRAVNILAVAITVPIVYKNLSSSGYAVYAVSISLGMLLAFADLGFGSSIVNIASGGNGRALELRAKLSRLWWTLVVLSAIIIALAAMVLWGSVHLFTIPQQQYIGASLVAVIALASGLAPSIYQRLAFAQQRHIFANLNTILGRLASVLAIYTIPEESRSTVAYIMAGLLPATITSWIFFLLDTSFFRRELSPYMGFRLASLADLRESLSYSVIQVASFLEIGLDTALVTFALGGAEAARFDVLNKIFIYVPVLVNIFALPLWPHVAHSMATGRSLRYNAVIVRLYVPLSLLLTATCVPLVLMHDQLISLWLSETFHQDFLLASGLALMAGLLSLWAVQTAVLNGLGIIGVQAKVQILLIAASFPVKLLALYSLGTAGMIFSFAILYCFKALYLESKIAERLKVSQ